MITLGRTVGAGVVAAGNEQNARHWTQTRNIVGWMLMEEIYLVCLFANCTPKACVRVLCEQSSRQTMRTAWNRRPDWFLINVFRFDWWSLGPTKSSPFTSTGLYYVRTRSISTPTQKKTYQCVRSYTHAYLVTAAHHTNICHLQTHINSLIHISHSYL